MQTRTLHVVLVRANAVNPLHHVYFFRNERAVINHWVVLLYELVELLLLSRPNVNICWVDRTLTDVESVAQV